MTESVHDEKIVISADPSPSKEKIAETKAPATASVPDEKTAETTVDASHSHEKIVDRKTIVYQTRADPNAIKLIGEKLKTELFAKFYFFKPPREDVQLVSINKYYEPFIVISGKYAIDYYRKSTYAVKLDGEVQEVILLNEKFVPEQPKDPNDQSRHVIELKGEERITKEFNACIILDRHGKDVPAERLLYAPSEKEPQEQLAGCGIEEIGEDADLDIVRSRILKRPNDIDRIVNELIEINERVVIYAPRFKITYRNATTHEEKAIEFDGITAKRIYTTTSI